MHELNDAITSVNKLATTLPQTAYMQSYDRDVSAIQHLLFLPYSFAAGLSFPPALLTFEVRTSSQAPIPLFRPNGSAG